MATLWDLVLPRGRTTTLLYPYRIGGVDTVPSGYSDIRWLAKVNPLDADSAEVISKSILNGGLTVVNTVVDGITYRLQVQLSEADTAPPNISAAPGTVVLYLGLVALFPGSPLVGYDLFGGAVPTLTLLGGVVQAIA